LSQGASVRSLLQAASARFEAAGIETARLDAEFLLSHLLGCGLLDLIARGGELVVDSIRDAFEAMVARRETLEPVAYILGEQEFWSLTFKVTNDTLIPRPDTETLVEVALEHLAEKPEAAILDLGTGSGCILLSLLHECELARGTAVDISRGALSVAAENAGRHGLQGRTQFLQASWFDALMPGQDRFDLIVSNPPYIPTVDIVGLMQDVRGFEPMGALDGGDDGLAPYRLITQQSSRYLTGGGMLAVEMGVGQARDVAALFEAEGFQGVAITKDLAGLDRVVSGKK